MNHKDVILVVDDSDDSLMLLNEVLTMAGYKVRLADNGNLAIESAMAERPDLILVDIRMPGMDGLEVCRRLKEMDKTRPIPVILTSGFATQKDWIEGLKVGAADYVAKPFLTEDLLSRVRTHIEVSRAREWKQDATDLRQLNQRLEAEIAKRQEVEAKLRENLQIAERSRRAILSMLEDRNRAESILREREQQLKLFIEYSPAAIAMFDRDMKYLVVSRRWISDYHLQDQNIIGRSHYDVFPELSDRLKAIHQRCLNGSVEKGDADPFPRLDGTTDWVRWEVRPWHTADGQIGGIILFSELITELIQAEAEIRQWADAFENCAHGVAIGEPGVNRVKACNPALARMLGRHPEEVIGMSVSSFYAPEYRELIGTWITEVNRTGQGQYEARMLRKDGSSFPTQIDVVAVRDDSGEVKYRVTTIQDITERKQTEETLRTLLDQQTALIKEVHHRVKNNLQIVSSLLNLQSRQVQNEAALQALRDTQGRIRSMALLHETLHREGNMTQVNSTAYLGHLCEHLRQSFSMTAGRIRIQTQIAPVQLDLDYAIPCGLMVNELVSNSFKHAFPGDRAGRIIVDLHRTDTGSIALTVSDDGVGLPPQFNIQKSETLGTQLVSGLAKQIGAELEIHTDSGTRVQIRFCPSQS